MKKIFTLLFSVAAFTSVHSQVRVGVKGGLNLANQTLKVSGNGFSVSKTGDMIASYQVGVVSDITLTKGLHFRPELLLSGKGSDFSGVFGNTQTEGKAKIRPSYLELPLNLVYYREGRKANFYLGGGPSIAYGIFGKVKQSESNLEEDAFQDGGFKRLDLGLNFLTGVDFAGGFTVGAHITPGLTNIADVDAEEGKVKFKNLSFGVTVGYFFSK